MLKELRASQIGVIDDLALTFEPGLNVLTGETGAGKSLVVGALTLLTGAPGDAAALRTGAAEAELEARFTADDGLRRLLDEAGLPAGDEIVIARRIRRSGSRAYVNGRMATLAQLAGLGAELVEVVGQHTARNLTRPSAHREALDRYGAETVAPLRRRVEDLFERRTRLARALEATGGDPAALARESEILQFQIDEIDAAGIRPGEDTKLAEEIARLVNAEARREEAGAAWDALDSARDLVAAGRAHLARTADPALDELCTTLDSTLVAVDDVSGCVRAFVDACEADPEHLEELQRRLAHLNDLRRKYGPELGDVAAFRDAADRRLSEIKDADGRSLELEAELGEVEIAYAQATADMSGIRRRLAPELAAGLERRLRELAVAGARFEIEISQTDAPSRTGTDRVAFGFSGGPGQGLRSLDAVASGGELSRVMLALATEIAGLDAPPTIVFDEIDSGTGGEAAIAVGQALATLAERRQLLCVTHLSQVACFAGHHIAIRKDGSGVAHASELEDGARIVELSRMLSGTPESSRARRHAEELLQTAVSLKKNA